MQRLTTPFLAINVLFLALVSCGSNKVTAGFGTKTVDSPVYNVPYFTNPETDYVYKANITIYGNELTGIFIVKKINAATHRVVFTTEFGNKLIDCEISETEFKVNSIVSELDRKIVINTLRDDFRFLLRKQFAVQEQFENAENTIYKSADGKEFNYLFISKADKKLTKIVHASAKKEKINLSFTSENNIFAESISIVHQNIKLKITFSYFKP